MVTLTILLGAGLGRLLKMDRDTALLTSIGSSICGAAAVLGAEPVVKSKPYKAAVAVSTVVIFGTLSMFLYPALHRAGILDLTPEQMGLFTGATLHEVAHVVGAGNAMGQAISDPAIIVKMIRVMIILIQEGSIRFVSVTLLVPARSRIAPCAVGIPDQRLCIIPFPLVLHGHAGTVGNKQEIVRSQLTGGIGSRQCLIRVIPGLLLNTQGIQGCP